MAELIVPFLLALLPILWLVVALIALKFPAWKAAIGSFAIACVLAFAYWHMPVVRSQRRALRAGSWPCGPSSW